MTTTPPCDQKNGLEKKHKQETGATALGPIYTESLLDGISTNRSTYAFNFNSWFLVIPTADRRTNYPTRSAVSSWCFKAAPRRNADRMYGHSSELLRRRKFWKPLCTTIIRSMLPARKLNPVHIFAGPCYSTPVCTEHDSYMEWAQTPKQLLFSGPIDRHPFP